MLDCMINHPILHRVSNRLCYLPAPVRSRQEVAQTICYSAVPEIQQVKYSCCPHCRGWCYCKGYSSKLCISSPLFVSNCTAFLLTSLCYIVTPTIRYERRRCPHFYVKLSFIHTNHAASSLYNSSNHSLYMLVNRRVNHNSQVLGYCLRTFLLHS